jgi:hypothetical protein
MAKVNVDTPRKMQDVIGTNRLNRLVGAENIPASPVNRIFPKVTFVPQWVDSGFQTPIDLMGENKLTIIRKAIGTEI